MANKVPCPTCGWVVCVCRVPLRYPNGVRRFYGTYGTHKGAPCLWSSKKEAVDNQDPDERLYEFRVEMIREVKP